MIHGGANARPFETHINAFDLDLYLRIATELHLKRLIVAVWRRFSRSVVSSAMRALTPSTTQSSPRWRFTKTYGDYNTMRVLTQEIIQEAATAVYGSPIARRSDADGKVIAYDLSGDWPVKTICEAVSKALGEEITVDTPSSVLHQRAQAIGLYLEPTAGWGYVLEEIYGGLREGKTRTPVFYTDFPMENSALARAHRDDSRLTEKWDLVIFGSEQATAYSELTYPLVRLSLGDLKLAVRGGLLKAFVLHLWDQAPLVESPRSGFTDSGGDRMRKARAFGVLVVVLAVLMLSACAAGPNQMVDTGADPAGFWLGLWQGLISPLTFLISLFTSDVNVYEVQNNGNWYDFGFMLGVAMAFGGSAGGGSASAGRYRRRRRV